jgi:uncharacterized membrane protein YdfJ with MMPL/SSD domain
LFYRWGHFVTRYPKSLIVISLLIVLGALPFIPGGLDDLSAEGWVADDAETLRAEALIAERFEVGGDQIWAVFHSPAQEITTPEVANELQLATQTIMAHPDVEFVADYASTGSEEFISEDGHKTFVMVQLVRGADDEAVYRDLRGELNPAGVDVYWGGGGPANYTFNEYVKRDLLVQELVSLPITLVLLVVIFGAVVAASLPLSVGLVGIGTAIGGIAILARLTDTSVYVLHIATMIGLALAIDYSLFIVSRFREELAKHDVEEAVAITVGTSGKAVFFAGLTVGIGLVGLAFFPMYALRSMGFGGGIVVAMAVFFALTTLPAILTLLGPRIDRGQVRKIQPLPASSQGFWHWLAFNVMRWPVVIMVVVLAILFTVGSPFLRANFGSPGVDLLPADSEPRVAIESLTQDFPGQQAGSPVIVVVDTGDRQVLDAEAFNRVLGVYDHLNAMPAVEEVASVFDILPPGVEPNPADLGAALGSLDQEQQATVGTLLADTAIRFDVSSAYPANSSETENLVRDIRQDLGDAAGIDVLVAGSAAFNVDMMDGLVDMLPWAVGFIMVVSYLVLFLLLGSVLLPIKAILVNLLSLTAAFGALVWIFQEGNLSGLLMFDAPGYIVPTIVIMMFCVLFGLSMDYEVMMLSRMKEEYARTGNNTTAVAIGLERTGRVITGAALIMIVLFGAGVTNQLVMLKSLGVGMAIAIFTDATIVRGLLVPSGMRLMGRVNWWAPESLKRFQEWAGMGEVTLASEHESVLETDGGE